MEFSFSGMFAKKSFLQSKEFVESLWKKALKDAQEELDSKGSILNERRLAEKQIKNAIKAVEKELFGNKDESIYQQIYESTHFLYNSLKKYKLLNSMHSDILDNALKSYKKYDDAHSVKSLKEILYNHNAHNAKIVWEISAEEAIKKSTYDSGNATLQEVSRLQAEIAAKKILKICPRQDYQNAAKSCTSLMIALQKDPNFKFNDSAKAALEDLIKIFGEEMVKFDKLPNELKDIKNFELVIASCSKAAQNSVSTKEAGHKLEDKIAGLLINLVCQGKGLSISAKQKAEIADSLVSALCLCNTNGKYNNIIGALEEKSKNFAQVKDHENTKDFQKFASEIKKLGIDFKDASSDSVGGHNTPDSTKRYGIIRG